MRMVPWWAAVERECVVGCDDPVVVALGDLR